MWARKVGHRANKCITDATHSSLQHLTVLSKTFTTMTPIIEIKKKKKKNAHQPFYPDTMDAVLINRRTLTHIIRHSRAGSLG